MPICAMMKPMPDSDFAQEYKPSPLYSLAAATRTGTTVRPMTASHWGEADDLRRIRSRMVVLIERMLRTHCPHAVLTEIPENFNWQDKTLRLSMKMERLLFRAARSQSQYANENTLRQRIQLLSRQLLKSRLGRNGLRK